jgi:hypothetical protein
MDVQTCTIKQNTFASAWKLPQVSTYDGNDRGNCEVLQAYLLAQPF